LLSLRIRDRPLGEVPRITMQVPNAITARLARTLSKNSPPGKLAKQAGDAASGEERTLYLLASISDRQDKLQRRAESSQ
jgi:hypothetical protein